MTTRASTGVVLRASVDLVARVGGLITFPVLMRHVGVDGYGAYGQVHTLVGMLIPFAMLGTGAAMVRFFSIGEWSGKMRATVGRLMFMVALVAGAFSGVVAISAAEINRWFLGWPGGEQLFRVGACLIFVGAIEQVMFDLFRARQWFRLQSALQLGETLLSIGAVVTLVPAGWSLSSLLAALIIVRLTTVTVGLLSLLTSSLSEAPHLEPPLPKLREVIRFGLPLSVAGTGLWMMNLGDRLVIGHFWAPEFLGTYAALFMVASIVTAVIAPLNYPLYPRLMRAVASNQTNEVKREVRIFHRYILLVLIPSAVLVLVMMRPLLVILGGSDLQIGTTLVFLMIAPMFLDQWNGIAHYIVVCRDGATFSQNLWLTAGVGNLAINLILVPTYGLYGAAFATLVSFLGLEMMMFRKAGEFVPLGRLYRFDVCWKSVVSAGLAAVPACLLNIETAGSLLIAICSFGGIYLFCCVIVFREIDRTDLEVLINAFSFQR